MAVATKVRPILLFEGGKAEEAMKLYVSLFRGSEVISIIRYGPGARGAEGSVMKGTFSLGGQIIVCTDSVVKHDFTFTPATSFLVTCESEDEIHTLAAELSRDGVELMPLGEYGFSRQFAWVTDRYGVSWQLNRD